MSSTAGAASADRPLRAKATLDKVESLVFAFVLLFQVLGLFNPPEAFLLNIQDYSQGVGAEGGRSYPFLTILSHFTELVAVLLVMRHGFGYVRVVKRSPLVFFQVAVYCLSSMWSLDRTTSLRAGLHLFIYYIFALHLAYSYTVTGFVRMAVRLFAISALASLVLIVAFPGLGHEVGDAGLESAWRGATEDKNFLGAMASLGIAACGYSLLSGANDRRLAWACLLADLLLVFGSRSATSVVVSAVCIVMLAIGHAARSPGAKVFTIMLGLGASCILGAALLTVDDPAALLGRDSTLTGRTALWHAVVPLIRDRPLTGYGLDFWEVDSDYRNDVWEAARWKAPHAHNDFLDVTLQVGALGTCLFVLNYIICLFIGLRNIWRIDEGGIFCLMVVLNFMVRGLSETINTAPGTGQVTMLFVCQIYLCLMAFRTPTLARHVAKTDREFPKPSERPSAAGLAG